MVPRHVATCSGPARAAERALPCGHRVRVVHASLRGSSLFACFCCGGLHTSTMGKADAATLRPVADDELLLTVLVPYAAPVPTAATTTIPTPMIVDGSPPVRRRAAAGVASTCLLPSTEVRTGARSDSFAILVATFLPDTCSCVAVERSPGPLLCFRCRALARSRSWLR